MEKFRDKKSIWKRANKVWLQQTATTVSREITLGQMKKKYNNQKSRKQKWIEKQQCEYFKRQTKKIAYEMTWTWLRRRKNLKGDTESFLIEAQNLSWLGFVKRRLRRCRSRPTVCMFMTNKVYTGVEVIFRPWYNITILPQPFVLDSGIGGVFKGGDNIVVGETTGRPQEDHSYSGPWAMNFSSLWVIPLMFLCRKGYLRNCGWVWYWEPDYFTSWQCGQLNLADTSVIWPRCWWRISILVTKSIFWIWRIVRKQCLWNCSDVVGGADKWPTILSHIGSGWQKRGFYTHWSSCLSSGVCCTTQFIQSATFTARLC